MEQIKGGEVCLFSELRAAQKNPRSQLKLYRAQEWAGGGCVCEEIRPCFKSAIM